VKMPLISFPQGLKPFYYRCAYGTAKAVPFVHLV
jgi:hypothetical protein